MIVQKDELKPFVPSPRPQFFIFGTMGSMCARTIDGEKPKGAFYYNNNRNQFWRVIQHFFLDEELVKKKLSVPEKKQFLIEHNIGILNIVDELRVPNASHKDPSDTVIFEALKKGQVSLKKLTSHQRKALLGCPVFFTCRYKKGISELVQAFAEVNKLPPTFMSQIWYWPTPTRCNAKARSLIWKKEYLEFINK